MKPKVFIFDPVSGACVIECGDRSALIRDHQSLLEGNRGKYLHCGCRSHTVLKLLIAELPGGRFVTRAWPNQRDQHDPFCPAVGDEDSLVDEVAHATASDVHSKLEELFSDAYSAQVYDADPERIYFLERLKFDARNLFSDLYPDLCVGVGIVENDFHRAEDGPATINVTLLSTNKNEGLEKTVQQWPLGSRISVRCRKDRAGLSLPGTHLVVGLWQANGPLSHLHFWPIAEKSRRIHALHSRFEEAVLERLELLAPNVIKIPSIKFLSDWKQEARALFHRLAAEKIWPDFIVLSKEGIPTIVEAAGLSDVDYTLRLIEKMALFRRWEREIAIQWFIVKPFTGGGLKIAHRSAKLDLAAAFEAAEQVA